MSKARDLSKLGSGFEIDGSNSRIDSDFVLQVFKKFIVKRDNSSFLSGKDSDVFTILANNSPSTTTIRGDMDMRGDMVFHSYQKDSDRLRAYNETDTYRLRTGKHFDSDFANLVVDTMLVTVNQHYMMQLQINIMMLSSDCKMKWLSATCMM